MIRTLGTIPGRCGRWWTHSQHTWDTRQPNPDGDYLCDGKPTPKSALQLVTEHPTLLDALATAPGVVIAEGVRAS